MNSLPIEETAKSPSRMVALLYLVKRYKKTLTAVLFVSVITGVLENVTLGALHLFLQSVFNEGPNAGTLKLGKYFDVVLGLFPGKDPVVLAATLILIALFLKNISMVINQTMIGKVSGDTIYDLKKMLMKSYSQAHYQYFLDTKYGRISYSAMRAPLRVAQMMLHIPKAGAEIVKIGMIMGFLLYYNWQATLFCVVILSAFLGFIRYLSNKVSYHTGKGRIKAIKNNENEFNEFVSGIKFLKIFDRKQRWIDMFNRSSDDFVRLYKKDIFWLAIPKELLEFAFLGGAIMGLIIVRSSFEGSMTNMIPAMGVYFLGMMKILPSARNIGLCYMQVTNLMPDAEQVYRDIHTEIEPEYDGEKALEGFCSDITFKEVSFYHAGRDIILDSINLSIEKGKVTAIVGESGSGKSTILNLLLKLFEPSKGQITIDGQPLNSLVLKSWLDRVGFVGQDAFIFHSSIMENITFGNTQFSKDDVIKAAQVAGIHDFISSLPEGYETLVGERGMKLSGGQQQRLAIARAIIRNPEVLILDEATSSLDSITEENVQKAIDKTLKGRTVIMIAHRLSTVEHADKIVVVKQGRIVEEGTHGQLLDRQGEYWRLHSMQNRGGLSYVSSIKDENQKVS